MDQIKFLELSEAVSLFAEVCGAEPGKFAEAFCDAVRDGRIKTDHSVDGNTKLFDADGIKSAAFEFGRHTERGKMEFEDFVGEVRKHSAFFQRTTGLA